MMRRAGLRVGVVLPAAFHSCKAKTQDRKVGPGLDAAVAPDYLDIETSMQRGTAVV
jgi:hypothetical protein